MPFFLSVMTEKLVTSEPVPEVVGMAKMCIRDRAKDLGTGKEQHITITSSTNMSKDDVEKAVREAEQYAAEDKKRREEVDLRNGADQMIFQTEKALGELGDKVSASEKSDVEAKIADLKEALKG